MAIFRITLGYLQFIFFNIYLFMVWGANKQTNHLMVSEYDSTRTPSRVFFECLPLEPLLYGNFTELV